jgi:hypothetical protein
MAEEYLILGIIAVVGLICLGTTIFCIATHDDTELPFYAAIIFIVMVLLFIGIRGFDWDNRIMTHADTFFKTRDEVYKCEGQSPEVCKYKKLIWQKDSTIWQKRMDKIIKD